MFTLTGPERPPRSGGPPKQLVVILHGWGADGANLIDLAEMFAQSLPDAHFIAPNAPQVCEVNPYGYQWFSLMDRTPQVLQSGVKQAADTLNRFLDSRQKAMQLGNAQTALIGFSQGTMLALQVGLRRTPPVSCIVGFSGAVIAPEALAEEAVAKPPVCLIHGQMDEVVPYQAMVNAAQALKEHGISVESHTRPLLGHSIDMDGMEAARRFLGRHLR